MSVALNKLTSELVQPFLFEEDSKVTKVIGIYTGRFQPMGKHHADVYDSYKSKFDDFYVTTSNKVEAGKSPLNFKEKKKIIQKHGIPSSKIVQVRNTYKSEEVVNKFDEETTAIVFLVGSKDAGRLSGGKYFLDYSPIKEKGCYSISFNSFSICSIFGISLYSFFMRTLLLSGLLRY